MKKFCNDCAHAGFRAYIERSLCASLELPYYPYPIQTCDSLLFFRKRDNAIMKPTKICYKENRYEFKPNELTEELQNMK